MHSRKGWIVFTALCVAVSGDILTTWYGIEHAGLVEANGNVKPLLDAYGYAAMIVLKAGVVGMAILSVSLCSRLWGEQVGRMVYSPAVAVVALNVAVTAYNGMLILSA